MKYHKECTESGLVTPHTSLSDWSVFEKTFPFLNVRVLGMFQVGSMLPDWEQAA